MSENIVDDYGWSKPEGPHSCGYIVPGILEILENTSAKRVLDLGSGNGALCSELRKAGYDAVGVEYDSNGVDLARQTCPGINFYRFGVQDNPLELMAKESEFDAVVSTEVIEHLFSPHLLPIYANKVLKKDGVLIITTPYHGYLKNLALSIFNKWDHHHTPLWHGGHIKFWSFTTISKLLSENGLTVTKLSGFGRLPYLWKSMVVIAKKNN